ncbi:sulfotransferase 2A1-like [Antedon mediterranea]|uniref:sulfotransferase 2A1-like n=1 Tax=Antedon mediterranea TaxID=105859 RepID=UPI003AF9C9EE
MCGHQSHHKLYAYEYIRHINHCSKTDCCQPNYTMTENPKTLLGLNVINGFTWPPLVHDTNPEKLANFKVREDDVFVLTYPKSGTHWTQKLVKNILFEGNNDKIRKDSESNPLGPIEFGDNYKKYDSLSTEKPRVMMIHVPVDVLPRQVFEGKGKVVFVIRNPKDNLVSYWNFLKDRQYLEEYEEWDSCFEASLRPDMLYGNWFDFNLPYYENHRNKKNFLFLTYEEMKLDHKGCVLRICDFLSRPLSEEQVDKVVENTSFSSMKASKPVLFFQGKPTYNLLRKGVVGDWKTRFTVAQKERFDAIYNQRMEGTALAKRIKFEI